MESRTLCVVAAPPRSRSLHDPIAKASDLFRPQPLGIVKGSAW
jgi:hypothetical protein